MTIHLLKTVLGRTISYGTFLCLFALAPPSLHAQMLMSLPDVELTGGITTTSNDTVFNSPPIAICQPVTVDLTHAHPCVTHLVAADFDGGSSDPDNDPITLSIDPENPFPFGTTMVTLTVSDGTLTRSCTAQLTVIDTSPPVFVHCPTHITVSTDPGICFAGVHFSTPTLEADPCNSPPVDASLQAVLERYQLNAERLGSLIPNQFLIEEDVEDNNNIDDGGDDAYDNGNEMNTDSAELIQYSEDVVTFSNDFGPGSAYFTSFESGLWMMAADIADLSFYEITGELGADEDGFTYSFVDTYLAPDGTVFSAFVKGVSEDDDDPSVNHLILIPDAPNASQSFTTNTDDDQHRVDGLAGVTRIYQFNWYGEEDGDSFAYSPDEIDDIVLYFLRLVVGQSGLVRQTEGPKSGQSFPLGETTVSFSTFDAAGNTANCSFTVTVEDNEPPVVVACPTDTILFVNRDSCSVAFAFDPVMFTDNCVLLPILFVADNDNMTEIPGELMQLGFDVTVVLNDFDEGTEDNEVLQGDLSAFSAVFWHAVGSGSGSLHNAATTDNLLDYVLAGGHLFVTGYDVIDSPDDDTVAQLLGGNDTADTPDDDEMEYAILGPPNSLNSGLFDIIGLMPSGLSERFLHLYFAAWQNT